MKSSLYFTSNQSPTKIELGSSENTYEMIANWGNRLRKAMGEKEILSRNLFRGGEFRPPTYRAYAESLDRSPWTTYNDDGRLFYVQPYNSLYDGWKSSPGARHGLMAVSVNSYEYAYELWDSMTQHYHPDLLDSGTFAIWAELLPEPVSIVLDSKSCSISWDFDEPRVHRSSEMGRYQLLAHERNIEVTSSSWRMARAEAYVQAWEKMASNEPEDRYESVILAEQFELDKKWKKV